MKKMFPFSSEVGPSVNANPSANFCSLAPGATGLAGLLLVHPAGLGRAGRVVGVVIGRVWQNPTVHIESRQTNIIREMFRIQATLVESTFDIESSATNQTGFVVSHMRI